MCSCWLVWTFYGWVWVGVHFLMVDMGWCELFMGGCELFMGGCALVCLGVSRSAKWYKRLYRVKYLIVCTRRNCLNNIHIISINITWSFDMLPPGSIWFCLIRLWSALRKELLYERSLTWVRAPLQSLKLQILCLFRARSSLTLRQP